MKRNLKKLFMAVAVSAVSVFAVLGASCDSSASEWIEDKIEQIKCEHVTTKVIERVLPTCTEKGYTEGLECVDCGKVVTKPDEVQALGHTIVTYEEVEATCLTKGKTEGEYCMVCETWLKEIKDIKATGHSVEVIEGKDPTCTETGLTNGQACDKCGEVYVAQKVIPALGHDVNDSGKCRVCGCYPIDGSALKSGDNLTNYKIRLKVSVEEVIDSLPIDELALYDSAVDLITFNNGVLAVYQEGFVLYDEDRNSLESFSFSELDSTLTVFGFDRTWFVSEVNYEDFSILLNYLEFY